MTEKPTTIVDDPFIASNPSVNADKARTILSNLTWQRQDGSDATPSASVREWGCLEVRKNADIALALDALKIDWSYSKDRENYSTFTVSGIDQLAKLKQAGAHLSGHDLAHISSSANVARL